jgi:hypothetical protein
MATIEKTDATGMEMGLNTRELIACSPRARINTATEKGNFTESHSSYEKKDWLVATSEHVWTVKDRCPLPLMDERLDRLGTLGGNRASREYEYVTALEMFRVFIRCR